MLPLLLVWSLICSWLLPASGEAERLVQNGGKILFLGDSLTAGQHSYPEVLRALLQRRFPASRIEIAKHAVSGAKMSQLQGWAQSDFRGIHADACLIFVQDAGLTDTPVRHFEEALTGLISAAGKRGVYLINEGRKPGWTASDEILALWGVDRSDKMEGLTVAEFHDYWVNQLNPVLQRLAGEPCVHLVDYQASLARFYADNPSAEILNPDGLHLGDGAKFLLALLCLKNLGFSRSDLDLSADIELDQALKQAIVQAVFAADLESAPGSSTSFHLLK
ncbi:MAG: SGNH/GDSL hydrolase family protein [Acidobacteriota bacterium]